MLRGRGAFTRLFHRITQMALFNGLHRRKFALLVFLTIVIFFQVVIVSRVLFVRTGSRLRSVESTVALNGTPPASEWSGNIHKNQDITGVDNSPSSRKHGSWKFRKRFMRLRSKKVIATTRKIESVTRSTSTILPSVVDSVKNIGGNISRNANVTERPTLDYRILHEYWPPVNFSLVTPHIAPKIEDNLYLLVMINSGVQSKSHTERRHAIRRTWAHKKIQLENFGAGAKHGFPFKTPLVRPFRLVFLLGKSYNETIDMEIENEAKEHNDLVIGEFPDNYVNLIIKVYMGFKWAQDNVKSKFILKADDDTYVYIPRLTTLLESAPDRFFGGYPIVNAQVFRDVNNKHGISKLFFNENVYPPYCEGAFYVFTKNLLPDFIRLTSHIRPFHIEDVYMGVLLRYMGMRPVFIPGFYINNWMPGLIRNFKPCEWATAVAIGHRLEGSTIEYVHSKLPMIDPSRLSSKDWQACHRRNIPRNDNILSAVYGILISLSMILVYVTVAFLPNNYEAFDEQPFVYRRQNHYPYIHRVGR